MPDVFTKRKRSEVMARIRGRGNEETEMTLLRLLRRRSITGWRRNQRMLGKPDFIFRRERLAVFVDGCFWHGCPRHCNSMKWLKKSSMPANPPSLHSKVRRAGNRTYWRRKLTADKARDRLVSRELRRQGWRVVRIWQHDLARNAPRCIERIRTLLDANRTGDD